MAMATFDELIVAAKAKVDGDRKPFDQLRGLLVAFTPDFEILPGTAPTAKAQGLKAFEMPNLIPAGLAGD